MTIHPSCVLRRIVVGVCLASASVCAYSQSAAEASPSQDPDPREALAFYVGTWTQPEGKDTSYRETCSWLDQRRHHVVCRTSIQSGDKLREYLGIYSYDPHRAEYLYHGFGGSAGVYTERGQRMPKGFRFFSDRGSGADRVRTRMTLVESADGRVGTVTETATGDGPWEIKESVNYLRVRP